MNDEDIGTSFVRLLKYDRLVSPSVTGPNGSDVEQSSKDLAAHPASQSDRCVCTNDGKNQLVKGVKATEPPLLDTRALEIQRLPESTSTDVQTRGKKCLEETARLPRSGSFLYSTDTRRC
jgi:hypothetical protein